MKSLDEWNKERAEIHKLAENLGKEKTEIECPNCKKQLVYSGSQILMTHPPRRRVECLECNFQTTVIA